jgi:L-histidine N-alpha-methyltransferase
MGFYGITTRKGYKMKINNAENFLECDFARDVKEGLSKNLKEIPSKYFYDQKGSLLFDLITEQEEYYLTRMEKHILEFQFCELEQLVSQIDEIVEFGPGDGSKAEIILKQFLRWRPLGLNYKAVDISLSAIKHSLNRLSKFRNLKLSSHIGDFSSFKFSTNNSGRLFLFL